MPASVVECIVESRIAKHVEHCEVFGQYAGREVFEVLIPSVSSKALEQRGRDPASVKFVVDGKRHFGARLRVGEVRADSDDVRALFTSAADDQRERLVRVAVVAESL